MSVDFTKLKSFVKIVDAGSVSRAASILRTAQPALSQQIAALESHFKHKLLLRSNHGIVPTEAGLILYRHAQLLLKQIVVHINDSFGHVLSELIMTGKMDMAMIYGSGPIKGVKLQPLFREEL